MLSFPWLKRHSYLVAEFGWYTCGLYRYDKGGRSPLLEIPGTVGVLRGDWDGQGEADLLLLVAQEKEQLLLLQGSGQGFLPPKVLRQ